MMSGLLSTTMSVFLVLHTVLGCCWHHAHACTQECATTCSVESPDAHEEAACDHDYASSQDDGHQHHSQHDCQGQRCIFLHLAGRGLHGLSLQPQLAIVCCLPQSERPLDVAANGSYFATDALLPPLRLHLAHHVLLL
jgi:hypothetical protein